MKKIIFLLFILTVVGCASKKDVLYFQDIDETQLQDIDAISPDTKIDRNDILYIRITALDVTSVIPFQYVKPQSTTIRGTQNSELIKLDGYMVDNDGNIKFPQLGELNVKGKTPGEVEDLLQHKLSAYITDPTVSVRIANFKVSIIGEVKNPGTYPLQGEEHITLPQALGMAGDLTINGERHDVLIIRNEGDQRIYKHIDLTKSDWMNSPYYFLKQNDVVYVQPNNPKVKNAGFIGSIGNVLSVASILLSAAVIIFK